MRIELPSEVQNKIERIQLNRERGIITAREMFFQLVDAFLMISTDGWCPDDMCRLHQSIERNCFVMIHNTPLDIYIEDEEIRIVL